MISEGSGSDEEMEKIKCKGMEWLVVQEKLYHSFGIFLGRMIDAGPGSFFLTVVEILLSYMQGEKRGSTVHKGFVMISTLMAKRAGKAGLGVGGKVGCSW